jgi:hypothetical protein
MIHCEHLAVHDETVHMIEPLLQLNQVRFPIKSLQKLPGRLPLSLQDQIHILPMFMLPPRLAAQCEPYIRLLHVSFYASSCSYTNMVVLDMLVEINYSYDDRTA